jgi:4-azaleucine resistance transporter AzlC
VSRRAVVRDSLGVGVAVGAYGFAFGAASVAAGLSVLQSCLLSLLAFTGGTQFAVVGVVAGGGSIGAALAGGLLLGSRNTLYAMRLAPLLRVRGLRRLVAALGTIDESTAMAVAQPEPELARVAFWWTFGGVFTFWNLSTLLGAVAGSLVDPATVGLDAVVPAAFLALLAPRLRAGALERRIALAGAVIAFALIPVTPAGVPVLAASAALLLATSYPRASGPARPLRRRMSGRPGPKARGGEGSGRR